MGGAGNDVAVHEIARIAGLGVKSAYRLLGVRTN